MSLAPALSARAAFIFSAASAGAQLICSPRRMSLSETSPLFASSSPIITAKGMPSFEA